MKISEITNTQDKLDLLKSIMDNTWRSIAQPNIAPAQVVPVRQIMPAKPVVKVRPMAKIKSLAKPKKAPYAAAPKPLPKSKPLQQTPTQIKHQQLKNQQDYALAVKKTFDKDVAKIPKSLQSLPTNIVSPIGGGDPEFNKKLELARKQGEQNRSNGSLPRPY